MLTSSDWLEELCNTVALGELAWVADSAGADEPEEHAKCIDVDTAVILTGDQLWSHVQWCTNNAARHHCCRLAEAKVGEFAAIVEVQLLTTASEQLLLSSARRAGSGTRCHTSTSLVGLKPYGNLFSETQFRYLIIRKLLQLHGRCDFQLRMHPETVCWPGSALSDFLSWIWDRGPLE